MRHDLHVEVAAPSSLSLRDQWTAVAEGLTACNVTAIRQDPRLIERLAVQLPRYEPPRKAGKADQAVGTLPVVLTRGRATCIEIASIDAAIRRLDGDHAARVALIDVYSERIGAPMPYAYHAIVVCGDGSVSDPTRALPGAADVEWFAAAGHCCSGCALEEPGHKTVCTSCSTKGAP